MPVNANPTLRALWPETKGRALAELADAGVRSGAEFFTAESSAQHEQLLQQLVRGTDDS
jgi:hypothetical protein